MFPTYTPCLSGHRPSNPLSEPAQTALQTTNVYIRRCVHPPRTPRAAGQICREPNTMIALAPMATRRRASRSQAPSLDSRGLRVKLKPEASKPRVRPAAGRALSLRHQADNAARATATTPGPPRGVLIAAARGARPPSGSVVLEVGLVLLIVFPWRAPTTDRERLGERATPPLIPERSDVRASCLDPS